MLLMSETTEVEAASGRPWERVYLGNDDETWYTVRAELKGFTGKVAVNVEEQVKEQAFGQLRANLAAWFETTGDDMGCEAFGEYANLTLPDVIEETVELPNGFSKRVRFRLLAVERMYWPPAPVDPDPDPREGQRKPRSSDFRGDRFK